MKVIALIDRPEVVKRILGHLERAATALTGRAPPAEGTSSASAVTEGEASSQREPPMVPLFDDLPLDDLPFDDCPSDDVPLDSSPQDVPPMGDSA